MKNLEFEVYLEKLKNLDVDDKLKMIYNWVKEGLITLSEFKSLVDVIEKLK